jgi:hypothetical protein
MLLALLVLACSPDGRGGMEEVHAADSEVPAVVRTKASEIAALIGARLGDWAWDTESEDWECQVLGLSRKAELDVLPDGTFSELELVYPLSEVEALLPDVARTIHQRCGEDRRVLVELSLRSEAWLAPILEMQAAWTRDKVVIEFQCHNGSDFEMDARGMLIEDPMDDVEEPEER